MVLRSLAGDKETAVSIVERLMNSCNSMLKMYQYGTKEVDSDAIGVQINNLSVQSIEALVKDERIENLQNQMLPNCYAFDRFNGYAHDLGAVVNSLIDHPKSALSVQLISTRLSPEENSAYTNNTNA